MTRVLRADRRFARYCVAQLLTGSANLLTISVIVAVVTRDLDLGDTWSFWISTALIVAIPRTAMMGSLRRWGRLFDRLGVVRFRVVNIACWTVSLAFGLAGTLVTQASDHLGAAYLLPAVGLFAMRGLLNGLGLGGATLAWNLGHLHFAKHDDAEIYMGIHVSFTGMRGLVAPLLGMWLWWTIGWPVWLIALALSLGGLYMYASLAKEEQHMDLPTPSQRS